MSADKYPFKRLSIRGLYLIWGPPQGSHRSELMGEQLGIDIQHIWLTSKRGKLVAPIKYLIQTLMTLVFLLRHRYQLVFVQAPPILAALPVYIYSLFFKAHFIMDAHTDALLASCWAWSLPLHRFLSRRAITTIVTNDYLQRMVTSWKAHAFVLTDVPLTLSKRHQVCLDEVPFNVVMISTASYDEPTAQVLEAASKLPDVRFYITGNYNARHDVIKSAPPNVRFTGYVPDKEFYGLLEAAQVVMCLTTEDHTIQSGASEAMWLGKPIITSDWLLLQQYFEKGTIHVDNTAESICQAVMTMRENLQAFEADIRKLQKDRRQQWREKISALISLIQQATASMSGQSDEVRRS